jgi:hypothetical protein
MYDEIRKPRLLKDIPLLLIRGLSPVYYYCRFADHQNPEKAEQIFLTHLNFVASQLRFLGEELKNKDLCEQTTRLRMLENMPQKNRLSELEDITQKLSQTVSGIRTEVEKVFKTQKANFIDIYNQEVKKLKVLVVDNNREPERVAKLESTLQKFCYYEADKVSIHAYNYPEKLVKSDFVFYASTHPASIHSDIKSLKTYQKPGLAIAYIEKEGVPDRQAIRHGAQLQKSGFAVLYKVFTPIRLFTSVDKLYMKYHLNN